MTQKYMINDNDLATLYTELEPVPDVESIICDKYNLDDISELPQVRFHDAIDFVQYIKKHRFNKIG